MVRVLRGRGRPAFAAAAALDRRLGGTRYRDYVLRVRLHGRPVARPYPRLIGGPELAKLSPPQVLVSLHSGPLRALDPFWPWVPGDVAVLHGPRYPPPENARSLCVSDDEPSRLAVSHQAARVLQAGGSVFMTPDAEGTARVTADLMGARFSLASGGFALARLTASPMVPLAMRWRGSAIEIVTGAPIPPDCEAVMVAGLMRWFTEYFRTDPDQFTALLERSRRLGLTSDP